MWVSLFVLLLSSVMPPRRCYRRAAGYPGRESVVPWEESQERSDQIDRRMEYLLFKGLRCFSQAYIQAQRQTDNQKWLKKHEFKKIQEECEDECCDPSAYRPHWYEADKLEYERERLANQDKHKERIRVPFENYYDPEIEWTVSSSSSATSSTIRGSINTTIPKAAADHCLVRQLLTIANENPRSGEAATEHSEIPQAACQGAKRPRKEGKGSSAHARTKSPDPKDIAG